MNKRRLVQTLAVIVWTTGLLYGCSGLLFEPPPVDPLAQAGTPEVTSTSAPRPSDTPVPPTSIPCAYAWANKDLPDETALVQEALNKANLGDVEAALSAYGENCLDTSNDKILSFTPQQTDFYFSIPMADLNNRAEMGRRADQILRVVAGFPPGSVPGTSTGYIALVYGDGREEVRLWFAVERGLRALENNLSGEALFDALASNP